MRRFQEKYVQSGPNVNTVILVFTKVYAERFFNFFASMGGQKGPVFYIYYEGVCRIYLQALSNIWKEDAKPAICSTIW